MLGYILLSSIIPFILWIIQKFTNNLSSKSNYLRRRIFALQMALIVIFEVLQFINLYSTKNYDYLMQFVNFGYFFGWVIFFSFGLSKKDFKENRGYIYSIWEPYDPEYVNFSNGWIKAIKKYWQGLGGETSSKK